MTPKHTLSFKIDRGKLHQIDALAQNRGGRSAFMRQIVDVVLRQAGMEESIVAAATRDDPKRGTAGRLYLRLSESEIAVIRVRAAERNVAAATWVSALVRRHLSIRAPVEHALREELLNCRHQLQRIGRNVNQVARAANRMALADNAMEIAEGLARLNEMRCEIGEAVEAIGAATKGDLAYWEIPDE